MKNNRFLFAIAAALLVMTSGCKLSNHNDYGSLVERYTNGKGDVTLGNSKDAKHYVMGGATFAATEVDDLSIDWLSDSVTIEVYDGEELVISETSDKAMNDSTTMYYYLNAKGTLNINYGKPGVHLKRENCLNKHLLVRVPQTMRLEDVEMNGLDHHLVMNGVRCESLELNTMANKVTLNECEVDNIEINSVISNVEATFSQMPKEMEMNNVSGETVLWVPEDAGITLEMAGMMSDFRSELPVVKKWDKKVIGNGACKIECNAVGGELNIKVKR